MTVNVSKPALNVREKLAELDKPTGIAGEAMLRAETPQEQFSLIGAGRRNAIINGNFMISQRGDYSSATAVTNGNYYVDRFYHDINGVTATVQRVANGYANRVSSLKIAATSTATGYIGITQRTNSTENNHLFDTDSSDYVVFSMWMKSNTSNAGMYIYNDGRYGRQTHSGNGQWEYLVARAPLSEMTATTIDFHATLYDNGTVSVSSGDYIEIAYVQVERNATGVATPFEHRSYGEELAACQRYYQIVPLDRYSPVTFRGSNGSLANSFSYPLPVTMRANATGTSLSGDTAYWGSLNSASYTIETNTWTVATNIDGASYRYTISNATSVSNNELTTRAMYGPTPGYLSLDAEL